MQKSATNLIWIEMARMTSVVIVAMMGAAELMLFGYFLLVFFTEFFK